MLSYILRLINIRSAYGIFIISIALSIVNLILIISTGTIMTFIFGGADTNTTQLYVSIQRYFSGDNTLQIVGMIYVCSIIAYAALSIIFLKISYYQEYLISNKIPEIMNREMRMPFSQAAYLM